MDTLSDDKIRTTLSRNLFSYIADRIPRGIDTISSNKNDVTASFDMIPSSRTQKYKNLLGGILCPEKVKLMQ